MKYREGRFDSLFHQHVPVCRLAQERAHEALRSLIARYSDWPGEWILHSLLNDRGGEPQRYPGFSHNASYPEPGVLRHTFAARDVYAWCDRVVSASQFRR